jgi:hypothetical protein
MHKHKQGRTLFLPHYSIFLTSKLKPREFGISVFFIGGAVTFTLGPWTLTLGPWSCVLRRIPGKNDRCVFTRGRGEVMIFFEKNRVLGVESNRVLNILQGNFKKNTT